ncbi:hypothetical protein HMPREF3038_03133 [Akkermansia sp. KLE1797]|nr:hypothetical protein HMPREF3038_03133 [Akkermansia sp. KLE1797]KXU52556.1 hypothetical protein HMPREF3039_03334 [Akkermansia sp. KLE1798]KZA03286.1 hypothetical protein HMPREF1326_03005 [Akkermansia sp. KLE1605]
MPAERKETLFPPLPGREQGTMPFSPSALGNIAFCAQPGIPAFPFHPVLLQFIQGEFDAEQLHDEYARTRDQKKAHLRAPMPMATTVPMALRASAPEPEESISGMQPRMKAREVIRIGRRRRRAAFHQAFVALHFQIGKFHDQDGILAAHPASITRTICAQSASSRLTREMVSGVNSGTGNRQKVGMRTTGTAIGGISVARWFYRKIYTRKHHKGDGFNACVTSPLPGIP